MPRAIWQDEGWEPYNGSPDPQYRLENDRLNFLNPISQPGTLHSSGNMNNLFYFYNLMSIDKSKYKATGLGSNLITETVSDAVTGKVIASNVSQKVAEGHWIITEKLYNGDFLVQERRIEYKKTDSEWEATIT